MRKSTWDAVVLGAGPSGSAVAAELAERGWKVLLTDKASFPREKVCGGFVGPENYEWLHQKGLWNRFLETGASPIRKVWMTTANGASLRMHFSKQGSGVSGLAVCRTDFDQALVKLAESSGAIVRTSFKMQSKEKEFAQFLDLKSGETEEIKSSVWIDARGAGGRSEGDKPAAFGVMAFFENVRWMNQQVVLHFVEGGHFGLNPVNSKKTAICYVAEKKLMDRAQGDMEKMLEIFRQANPFIDRQMKFAKCISAWRGIPVPPVRKPRFFDGDCFFVGDAVTAVNPVVGGGMTMAIQSGRILANSLSVNLPDQVILRDVAALYEKEWKKLYQMKTHFSHGWGWLSHRDWAANRVLGFFASRKNIFRTVFEMHHPTSLAGNAGGVQ